MPSIRALGVSFAYRDAVPLFTDADFVLPPGWTGLVGPNGAGKSTLLQLLAGELEPVAGTLRFEPERALVHLCPQPVEDLDPSVEALAEDWSSDAIRIRQELALDSEALARWSSLSPGERKRWQIGSALARSPDVLLLDEPTNHLDAEARSLLLRALRRFTGVGIVVSHDRALLDELTERTLWLEAGELTLLRGSYTSARAHREAERSERLAELTRAQTEERRLKQRLAQARQEQGQASAKRNVGKRMCSRKDSDARTLAADFRAERAEKQLGKQVERLRREASRATDAIDSTLLRKELGRNIFLLWQPAPKAKLITLEEKSIQVGDRMLLRDLSVTIGRTDKIHLSGPNGAGKSTLLTALLAAGNLPYEKVLYLPQELSQDDGRSLLEEVRLLPPDERGRLLSLVAALGLDPGRLLASDRPSPGEARKLCIALGMARHAWLLALDEPTNHLDLPAIERLEEVLAAWPGALLLVTHDDALAARTTQRRWRFTREGLVEQG